MKLAIVTTHPIQYNSPLFKLLSLNNLNCIKVFYTWGEAGYLNKYDPGFVRYVEWDVPLLDGYDYEFSFNKSKNPGSHHFNGIKCPNLIASINLWKPDSLLIYGWNNHAHLSCIRYFKGKIPVFFRGDSTLIDSKPHIKALLRKIFLKWVYSHVDFAFYTGVHNRSYFLKYGMKSNQLIFAPHVVDNEIFFDSSNQLTNSANEWRSSLGISNNNLVFLFAGKLENKKNPQLLVKAFRELIKSNNNCILLIVGDGILKDKLIQLSKIEFNDNFSKRIFFIPFQNQSKMPIVYRMADVFVLPSQGPGETWGLAVNEAMASGKPVILSEKVGCAPDLVEQGVNGFVFKSGDTNDLISKLKIFGNNAGLIEKMGKASLDKISSFSLSHLANIIEDSVLNKCC